MLTLNALKFKRKFKRQLITNIFNEVPIKLSTYNQLQINTLISRLDHHLINIRSLNKEIFDLIFDDSLSDNETICIKEIEECDLYDDQIFYTLWKLKDKLRERTAPITAPAVIEPRLPKLNSQIPVDKCQISVDKCQIPVDKCQIPVDKGQIPVDKGQIPVDKGQISVDKGQISVDKGQIPIKTIISSKTWTHQVRHSESNENSALPTFSFSLKSGQLLRGLKDSGCQANFIKQSIADDNNFELIESDVPVVINGFNSSKKFSTKTVKVPVTFGNKVFNITAVCVPEISTKLSLPNLGQVVSRLKSKGYLLIDKFLQNDSVGIRDIDLVLGTKSSYCLPISTVIFGGNAPSVMLKTPYGVMLEGKLDLFLNNVNALQDQVDIVNSIEVHCSDIKAGSENKTERIFEDLILENKVDFEPKLEMKECDYQLGEVTEVASTKFAFINKKGETGQVKCPSSKILEDYLYNFLIDNGPAVVSSNSNWMIQQPYVTSGEDENFFIKSFNFIPLVDQLKYFHEYFQFFNYCKIVTFKDMPNHLGVGQLRGLVV